MPDLMTNSRYDVLQEAEDRAMQEALADLNRDWYEQTMESNYSDLPGREFD